MKQHCTWSLHIVINVLLKRMQNWVRELVAKVWLSMCPESCKSKCRKTLRWQLYHIKHIQYFLIWKRLLNTVDQFVLHTSWSHFMQVSITDAIHRQKWLIMKLASLTHFDTFCSAWGYGGFVDTVALFLQSTHAALNSLKQHWVQVTILSWCYLND